MYPWGYCSVCILAYAMGWGVVTAITLYMFVSHRVVNMAALCAAGKWMVSPRLTFHFWCMLKWDLKVTWVNLHAGGVVASTSLSSLSLPKNVIVRASEWARDDRLASALTLRFMCTFITAIDVRIFLYRHALLCMYCCHYLTPLAVKSRECILNEIFVWTQVVNKLQLITTNVSLKLLFSL